MVSKDESPKAQHASPSEEHASPKKRRKVNHGGYDRATNLYTGECELTCIATSMHILSALGELQSLSLHSSLAYDFRRISYRQRLALLPKFRY